MKILQINLNHCTLAHEMLAQTAAELKADIVLISEPLRNPGQWLWAKKGRAAIWMTGQNNLKSMEDGNIEDEDFAAVRVGNCIIISIYFSPSLSTGNYSARIKRLMNYIKKQKREGKDVVVAGDWNASSPAWGAEKQNLRGVILLQELTRANILPIIPKGGPTFLKGNRKSNVDFLATTTNLQRENNTVSRILNRESFSDHRYIFTQIETKEALVKSSPPAKWKVTKPGLIALSKNLNKKLGEKGLNDSEVFNEEEGKEFVEILYAVCEESLLTTKEGKSRGKPNIWWKPEFHERRKKVQRMRREGQRARKRGNAEEMEFWTSMYKKEKKELAKEIWKAKEEKWKEFCNTIDGDVWGKPYKGIIKRVKGNSPPAELSPEFAEVVLEGLFPRTEGESRMIGTESRGGLTFDSIEDFQEKIKAEEIRKAAGKFKAGKAAGLDGMPPEVLKAIVGFRADRIAALFNGIMERGVIPKNWKAARVILLRKEGKDTNSPASYRPICILNAVAKLFEYILRDRLLEELGEEEAFHEAQYGFRKGRSTIQAIKELKDIAVTSTKKQRYAAMIALDIKNAFNTLEWMSIGRELTRRRISKYLIKILDDYFKEREIKYKAFNKEVRLFMERGVPQGSILGPTLWNLVYDGLLRLSRPKLCNIIAFADDVVMTAEDRNLEKLKLKIEEMVEKAREWMGTTGLALAEQKTEAMMLNGKRFGEEFYFRVGEAEIKPKGYIKYLGVTMDSRKKFYKHIEVATNKGVKLITAFSRIMGNYMKTGAKARRLYYLILESVVLYGAPIWEGAHSVGTNKKLLSRTQKIGLARVISAYRSVPNETLCVLTGIPPWDLKITERKELFTWENEIFNDKEEKWWRGFTSDWDGAVSGSDTGTREHQVETEDLDNPRIPNLKEFKFREEEGEEEGKDSDRKDRVKRALRKWLRIKAKERTMKRWQLEWDAAKVGRWTHELIPEVEKWVYRKHGELNFFLTQVLTGHGVFNAFRHRIGKAKKKDCWYHAGVTDSPEHTVMECDRWAEERERLMTALNITETRPDKGRILQKILDKESGWRAFSGFCRNIMEEKAAEERRREAEGEDEEEEIGLEEDLEAGDHCRGMNL